MQTAALENGDEIGERLVRLADELRRELGDRAIVTSDDEHPEHHAVAWEVVPVNPESLSVHWMDFGKSLQIEAGHVGGRWELDRTMEDVDFIDRIVHAVADGMVVEVFGPGRSRVEVAFPDGTQTVEIGGVAPKGCLPVPGWARRGRRVNYAPY